MPEVYIHAIEGRTLEQKRALVKEVTDAVVRNFKVAPEAVMVQILESPKELKAKGSATDRPAESARRRPASSPDREAHAVKVDHPDADDRCPACGGPVGCGVADGDGTCWCFALPPVMPMPPDAAAPAATAAAAWNA
jgi:4-oxalocrotonate tautomerase